MIQDCLDHERLWIALKEMGVSQHLIARMCNPYWGQEATVRTESGDAEWLPIGTSARQRCI